MGVFYIFKCVFLKTTFTTNYCHIEGSNSRKCVISQGVVDRSQNRPDLHFPPRIRAKISEYAPILTFQITFSFMVKRIENTPDFHLTLGQQRKKFQIFHQFTTYAEFGD